MLTVPNRHREIGAGEDHEVAGLDDLADRMDFVWNVADSAQDEEQRVVVAFQLRPLMSVDDVLDGQGVQVEDLGDIGHLVLVRVVQSDPYESGSAIADLGHCVRMAEMAGQPPAVDVYGTVDHRTRCGDRDMGQLPTCPALAPERR